jgi:hypothetical protein
MTYEHSVGFIYRGYYFHNHGSGHTIVETPLLSLEYAKYCMAQLFAKNTLSEIRDILDEHIKNYKNNLYDKKYDPYSKVFCSSVYHTQYYKKPIDSDAYIEKISSMFNNLPYTEYLLKKKRINVTNFEELLNCGLISEPNSEYLSDFESIDLHTSKIFTMSYPKLTDANSLHVTANFSTFINFDKESLEIFFYSGYKNCEDFKYTGSKYDYDYYLCGIPDFSDYVEKITC